MKPPLDTLAGPVVEKGHALPQHGKGAANRPLVFSDQQPKTCLLGRAKRSPFEAIPRAGCFFLRSSNSKTRKSRLPQKSVSPHIARWSLHHPQVHLESQGLVEPSLRDRSASERARVSPSLRGQTRKHPGVAPTSENFTPAIGASGKLTTPTSWQACSRPAISRGQSNGWVNYAHTQLAMIAHTWKRKTWRRRRKWKNRCKPSALPLRVSAPVATSNPLNDPCKRASRLLRVQSEYFVAGAIFDRLYGVWSCTRAAPIIRWMVGKPVGEIKLDLLRMGAQWDWHEIERLR